MMANTQNKLKFTTIALFTSFITIIIGLNILKGIVSKVKTSKLKVAEINRDISLIDKVNDDVKKYESEIKEIVNTLPHEYYELSFFNSQIENIAKENNLTLDIQADKEKKEEKELYDSIGYSISMTGKYLSFANFLSQMSKLPYHTKIDKINIFNEEGVLTAKINFRIFVQK